MRRRRGRGDGGQNNNICHLTFPPVARCGLDESANPKFCGLINDKITWVFAACQPLGCLQSQAATGPRLRGWHDDEQMLYKISLVPRPCLRLLFSFRCCHRRPTMLEAQDSDMPPEIAEKQKNSVWTYLTTEISLEHADVPIIATSFVSGLCDSSSFNAWSAFVCMQTGELFPSFSRLACD